MKKAINVIIAPSDILNSKLDDIMGGGCNKVKNKCKDGEITVVYKPVKSVKQAVSAW